MYNSYHWGFNFGFNCSEAVNYATKKWREHYINTKLCSCSYGIEMANLHKILGRILKKHVPIEPPTDPRYDNIGHWALEDPSTSRSRCKFEMCGMNNFSRFYCEKCKVHLCQTSGRNCFYNYHHFDDSKHVH